MAADGRAAAHPGDSAGHGLAQSSWGIDPSTKRVALATWAGDGTFSVRSQEIGKAKGASRLTEIADATFWLARTCVEAWPPVYVAVEQPGGRHVHPNLWYAVGVVIEALHSALEGLSPYPVTVATFPPGTWKAAVLGNGSAPKETIMEWAVEQGYRGTVQDEADALAIAAFAYPKVVD